MEAEQMVFPCLADRNEKAADVMIRDLQEWILLFQTRPLPLPA